MENPYTFLTKRILILWLSMLVVAVVVLASSEHHPVNAGVEQEKRVRDFVEAFNARNPATLNLCSNSLTRIFNG